MSTSATLAHHLQSFSDSVDSIMLDYTSESVLFTPDGQLRGPDQIREFFAGFLASAPRELIEAMTVVRQEVDGEIAYIIWKAEPFIPLATDTFLIRDGKILVQTFAALVPTTA